MTTMTKRLHQWGAGVSGAWSNPYPYIEDYGPSSELTGLMTNMEAGDVSVDTPGGCSGRALAFGGVDEYVDLMNALNFERTDIWSVSFWIKWTTTADYYSIIGKILGWPSFQGWEIDIDTAGHAYMQLVNDIATANYIASAISDVLNDGAYHHVVFTYDGSSTNDGIGGIADGTTRTMSHGATVLSATIKNSNRCGIAGRPSVAPPNCLPCTMAEVVVYNKVLSLPEAQALYGAGSPVDPRFLSTAGNILAYWKMGG